MRFSYELGGLFKMLVFVSDLHFLDETTGVKNLPKSAFEKFISSLTTHVQKTKDVKKLEIVFLGDIFDLLRSETWLEEEEKDRPWGSKTSKMEGRAISILEHIIEKNDDTFELFSKESLRKEFKGIHVENIYIPGNHDRLCWILNPLKEKVIKSLSLDKNNKNNFKHYFTDTEHGVYALHGHIFDSFNYEGGPFYTNQDHEMVPIGDPMTTEIFVKLPYKLMQKIEKANILNEEEKFRLRNNFKEIGNIRPFGATLKWLFYQISANIRVEEIIEDTINEVITEFEELEFVQSWYKKHDKWNPFEMVDILQATFKALKNNKLLSFEKLFGVADNLIQKFSSGNDIKGAKELFCSLSENYQYIIMGHTHCTWQEPLMVNIKQLSQTKEYMYLNTGTWIKNYYKCKYDRGFVGWKNMNYVIVYTPDEKPNKHGMPVFETWQGTEKREEE
jgi:UDP-2,3-diacylglucosamine pyrophosphatase LpxH